MLSNILLTPFDKEMRSRGYQLTRFADDWVVTCKSAAEARAALAVATKVLKALGVEIHPSKTRIVHVRQGFEFLEYKIKQGSQKLRLPESKIWSSTRQGALYAYPRQKSIEHFKEQIRRLTGRRVPLTTAELIGELNPILVGWSNYYKKAHVRRLFRATVTLQRPQVTADIPWPKVPQKLPDVLSRAEVEQILAAVHVQKYRALFMTAYGAGLRISEACVLHTWTRDLRLHPHLLVIPQTRRNLARRSPRVAD